MKDNALKKQMQFATDRSQIHFWQFRSLFLVDAVIVTVSVMAFGLLSALAFDLNSENAVVMIFMIPFMAAAVGVSSHMLLKKIRAKMDTLLEATLRVADGDLSVELDPTDADEYTAVYVNFNNMVKELRVTKSEMESSVNVLAHEFKTPITSISGFADYLISTGNETETPERLEYLKIIRDEALRLSAMSQNTLLLSKVEACQIITDKQHFNMSEQVRRCALLVLPQMEKKGISLEVDLPDDMAFYGNSEMTEQIWINLLNNALKFTPEEGTVTVRGSSDGQNLRIAVSDTGCGMSEETASHIFEKYYQNDQVSSIRGNGIGLSIVARIVKLCGGKVEVESKEGTGSIFTVVLPVNF